MRLNKKRKKEWKTKSAVEFGDKVFFFMAPTFIIVSLFYAFFK